MKTTKSTSKSKKSKAKTLDGPTRYAKMLADNLERQSHLHVVIDDELRGKLEAHARKVEGLTPKHKNYNRPNLSAAVRNLLRASLGLPLIEAA